MTQLLRRPPAGPRGRATVERLLGAADRLLADEGAEALGTTRLAETAGVAVGTVYTWFPDKAAIAEALAVRYWEELADLITGLAESAEGTAPGDGQDVVATGIDTIAAGFRARPGFLALWFGGLRDERLRDVTRGLRVEVAASVARLLAVAHPEADREARTTVAELVVLLGDGILREAFRRSPHGDATILREGTAALSAYVATRLGA